MLKVAFAGAWHVHFHQYATELSGREDCEIVAIWDSEEARGKAAAQEFHCDFEPDYDKMLARDDVQAIAVVSETNLHPELIIKAAQAGKHVFTEKVLAFTMEDALKIKDAIQKSGVKFCIPFFWRCRPEYLYTKNAVESGMLGKITYARVRNAHDGASSNWLPEYFYDPVPCGGGAMMDLGAHPMYLLRDLLGQPTAVTSVYTRIYDKPVEDNAVSLLEFGPVIASSETGFASKHCPFMLELTGTEGTLLWGGSEDKVWINTGDGFKEAELGEPLKRPTDQWVDGILKNEPIHFGIDDAVALTEIMEKAYQSSSEHKRVTF